MWERINYREEVGNEGEGKNQFEDTSSGRDNLVLKNLQLVHSAVRKFTNDSRSVLYQDLYSEGVLALVKSSKRYVPGSSKFSTYAYYRVVGSMLDYLKSNRSLLKVSRDLSSEDCPIVNSLSNSLDKHSSDFKQDDIFFKEDAYNEVEVLESIKSVLNTKEYAVFLLRYENYSQMEISKKINVSPSYLSKLLKSIREKVKPIISLM